MMRDALYRKPGFRSVPSLCPMFPRALAAVHPDLRSFLPLTQASFSVREARPNSIRQTESRRRIARDRSRYKRGPPLLEKL